MLKSIPDTADPLDIKVYVTFIIINVCPKEKLFTQHTNGLAPEYTIIL